MKKYLVRVFRHPIKHANGGRVPTVPKYRSFDNWADAVKFAENEKRLEITKAVAIYELIEN